MFRVVAYDTNECKTLYKSKPFLTKERAEVDELNTFCYFFRSVDAEDLKVSIVEVSKVTYASLIHSLSDYNEDICPVYTLNNMTVDECFEYGLDLSDESWNDFARVEIYNEIMIQLKILKETFDKNTKHVKCYLTDLI